MSFRQTRPLQSPTSRRPRSADGWYVLQTKQHREEQACFHLSLRNIEAYLPRVRLWPPPAVGAEVQPLFPGYLFARLDLGAGHHVVMRTPGVKRFVTFGSTGPAEMPATAVDFLREKEDEEGLICCDEGADVLGHRVMVAKGPLREFRGVVARRLSSSERVVILLDFLQPGTRVEVPAAWLKRDVLDSR